MEPKRIWAVHSYTEPTYGDVRPTWGKEGEDWAEYVHIDEYNRVVAENERLQKELGVPVRHIEGAYFLPGVVQKERDEKT